MINKRGQSDRDTRAKQECHLAASVECAGAEVLDDEE